ncbi:MAG: hypothetical protein IJS46_00255 [Kiritimatiellae bacterium]|nr:hypothetical protein [Kiritimatiellia bacterium]
MLAKASTPVNSGFVAFDPLHQAGLSLSFLESMADSRLSSLPWGTIRAYRPEPYAEHSRRDDSEFAASWYEGISCAREMLGTADGAKTEANLRKIVLDPKCWDDATGLRFPKKRPWSGGAEWCAISEMAPVLSALNRMIEVDPKDSEAAARAKALIAGLRRIATVHERRLTPVGEFPVEPPVYSFSADVVVRGKGFAPALGTGFADSTMRMAAVIHPVMVYHDLTGDEAALDLATGLANHLCAFSHFFSVKTEFHGEVHAALATAAGLARLGRVLSKDGYVARAKSLYDYVRRNSSAFGWVPEYLQWQLAADEKCDATATCDMIMCAMELVECNFPEYWDDIHRFWRNHLVQMQIEDVSFIPAANGEDGDARTTRSIASRLRGAVCGAAGAGFIAPALPGFVSARASAAAPRAMLRAWRAAVEQFRDIVTVNFPVPRDTPFAKVSIGYPNEGFVKVEMKKASRLNIRVYPWMTAPHEGLIDRRPAGMERREDHMAFPKCPKGSVVVLRHELRTRRVLENVTDLDFYGIWRGPDLVDLLPHSSGVGYRLYQRVAGAKREAVPPPVADSEDEAAPMPCEPPVTKDARLNRRKAPRT